MMRKVSAAVALVILVAPVGVRLASAELPGCPADCDNDAVVRANDVIRAVADVARPSADLLGCPNGDLDEGGTITREEIDAAARSVFTDCGIVVSRPDPDPCAEEDRPCESGMIGPFVVSSIQDGPTLTTRAWNEGQELFSLSWTSQDQLLALSISVPSEPAARLVASEGVFQLEAPLPKLREANAIAGVAAGLNSAIEPQGNHAGCDYVDDHLPPWWGACQDRGRCCDEHDFCIDVHCKGPNDSGFLPKCLGNPNCSAACRRCHYTVMECYFVGIGFPMGPSRCWKEGTCGKLQQCMSNGVVITDSCVCEDLGLHPLVPCARTPTRTRAATATATPIPHTATPEPSPTDLPKATPSATNTPAQTRTPTPHSSPTPSASPDPLMAVAAGVCGANCQLARSCDPEEFDRQEHSVQDCTNLCVFDLYDYSRHCIEATLGFFECLNANGRRGLLDDCDDEFVVAATSCPNNMFLAPSSVFY